jgi:glutamate---cysteine ligase / carboxylate-amine ligase
MVIPDIVPPMMGVEEEYLVVDPVTRAVVPQGARVVARALEWLGDQASTEITQFQVEAKSAPCGSAVAMGKQLKEMRSTCAAMAAKDRLALIASGTPLLGALVPPPITNLPRYDIGVANYRHLHDELSICAAHVHVHLPDRDWAVLVGNHLRPWLPVLITLTANSPIWNGRDMGYASWRTLSWGKWPVAGPPPYLSSYAEYERVVAALGETGALVDPGTVFWDVRPSAWLPTLEVRVADVPATIEETTLLASIVRALVLVSLERVLRGDYGPPVSGELLRAAYWRAARDGLEGRGIDPRDGRLRPAGALLDTLLRHITPALQTAGELTLVTEGLARLRAAGSGAARQRAALRRRGRMTDVVDHLIGTFESPLPDTQQAESVSKGGV